MNLEILTPDKKVYEGEASSVTLPGTVGSFEILNHHAPIISTLEDGKVTIDVIPIGDTVRLQVIADGWKTYGDDYKIDTNSKDIVVKMKRPGDQYSLYGDGHGTSTSTTAPKGESNSAKPSPQTPLPQ